MRPLALVVLLALLPSAAAAPEQIHASLDGTGIAIAWARAGNVTATVNDAVQWGTQGILDQTVADVSMQVIPPGTTLLSATVPLAAGTIAYRVGSDADGWSPTYNLTVPAPTEPWRIAVYGDHGTGADSEFSVALIPVVAARAPHLILHAGDLAYADGDAPIWNTWSNLVEPVAARALYMAAPGNHEHEGYYPASGPNPELAPAEGALLDPYHQFRSRFHFPGTELSYSFDAGPLHVLVLNTEDLCLAQPATYYVPWRVNPACDPGTSEMAVAQAPPNQALIDFARADLAAHAEANWTFVLMHRPVYTSGSYIGERILQDYYVPLFEEFGVDLIFSGHDHTYQRSYPLKGGEPVTQELAAYPRDLAPIYIVTGGGGEGLYTLQNETPAWTAFRAGEYHHVSLEVTPTALRAQVIATVTGESIDNFTLGDWRSEPAAGPSDGGKDSPGIGLALVGLAALALAGLRRR